MISYENLYKIVFNQVKDLKRPSGNMGLDVLGLTLTIPHYTTKIINLDDLEVAMQNAYSDAFYGGCEGEDDWYFNMVDAIKTLKTFIRELTQNPDAKFPENSAGIEMYRHGGWVVKNHIHHFK